MYPFRNILFPTDFTLHARAALKYAAAFAREGGGRVVLFSVQSGTVPANLLTLPDRVFEDTDNRWLQQLRTDVRQLLADPLFDGLEVEPVIIEGEPAPMIARAVREFDIDLVTIVTHGRKGLSRALWGSTAEEIIAEAPCPVLTIRPPQRDFVEHRDSHTEIRLNRILLATNFRPSANSATQVAAELAGRTGAELHVIYVIGDYMDQMAEFFPNSAGPPLARLREYVGERMAIFAREAGSRAITHISEGQPYAEIVRLATEKDVDLIVIGTSIHASLFGGAPVLGPDIERVVRNAPCPVLCVPSGRVVTPAPVLVTEPIPQMQ
ncbi:MAG TPA: universal stress protein [Pyrinomonadaceae bacterium]|jgi:nucleotide-binding universal stress UspA family protein